MHVLKLQDVGKEYDGRFVLEDVSLEVPQGVCVALIGHNGAGKTTLMKLLLGLLQPSKGAIEVLGYNPARTESRFRQEIGFLPENVSFQDQMTGAETLRFFAKLKRGDLKEVDVLLNRVGLGRAAHSKIKTYSKGMRQRLGLAQALLSSPKLLLLDEPTTGLDPLLRTEFFEIIRTLTQGGSTVLLSSHVLTELEARTDLAAILRDGRLEAFGDLESLRLKAGLPLIVRVKGDVKGISKKLNGAFSKTISQETGIIQFDCPPSEKMKLIQELAECGSLCTDIDVRQPTLDDLYLHYSGRTLESDDRKDERAP